MIPGQTSRGGASAIVTAAGGPYRAKVCEFPGCLRKDHASLFIADTVLVKVLVEEA